jgi:hypothetical protein
MAIYRLALMAVDHQAAAIISAAAMLALIAIKQTVEGTHLCRAEVCVMVLLAHEAGQLCCALNRERNFHPAHTHRQAGK